MDRLFSDDELDDALLGFEEGSDNITVYAESENISLLDIDEEGVDYLMHEKGMTEPEARQYVHSKREVARSMGVSDMTKFDFSLLFPK